MASTSTNIDPMNTSLTLTLNNIIDSYFEKDEADFNILTESNIDSLYCCGWICFYRAAGSTTAFSYSCTCDDRYNGPATTVNTVLFSN